MANPVSSIDVPLSLFSGWNTELSPPDQPEGASPANNDVAFTPGAVSTRPGLNRVFSAPIDSLGPFSYQKSYVLPSGNIKNLYFTMQDGKLWVEDVTNSPGTATLLFQSAGATYASSVTAQGREYIMLSDGVHGVDVPLQYDGTNLWRVTQDGPGAAPTVQSVALPSSALTVVNGATLARNNNTVTGNTATDHQLQVGYQVQISDVPDSNSTTVNQNNSSTNQVLSGGDWSFVAGAYRSNFNPGTSPLNAFVAQGFNFNIPSSATILGVIAGFIVEGQSTTTGTVNQVALWQSGAQLGTAKTPATPITTTAVENFYGSAADLWGAALTPAIVNDPTFGFAISCACDSVRVFLGFPFSVQVYYTLSGSTTVAIVSSIVIDNELRPGQALVTTTTPHGLAPNEYVSIVGVEPSTVANVTSAQWIAGNTTLTTDVSHGLAEGSLIQVAGVTTATGSTTFSFDGTFLILSVPSPDQLVYQQVPITATDPDVINATANTGTVTISWPLPNNTPTPNYFQVQSAPTTTTFLINIDYSDGTWTTGTVGFIWEGIFFVTAVPSPTQFQYQQYGPNGVTTALGTVTPYGQISPGIHLLQISFLLQSGEITAPSPYVQFVANGGQYLSLSNMVIGPSTVQARIIEITGSGGAYFFYIPVPAQVNGIVVSTATQINDNTSTTALLDFSDNTLFAALAVSIPGNNLQAQGVLGPSSGVFSYASRLLAWGQRNSIRNLVNSRFYGGFVNQGSGFTIATPAGWTALTRSISSSLIGPLDVGMTLFAGAIANVFVGGIQQSAYVDYNNAPIFLPLTFYSIRIWLACAPGDVAFQAQLTSTSTGFSSTATVAANLIGATGAYYTAAFSLETPSSIPSDLLLTYGTVPTDTSSSILSIAEPEIFYTTQPYIDNEAWISYADNLGAFDLNTGVFGPEDDLSPIRNFGVIRQSLFIVTGTGLHETEDNDQTEPSGWNVDQIADNCGAFSIASVARNAQGIGSSGKDWMMWSGPDGAQLNTGQKPWKISQEIQSVWDAIPAANAYQCWVKNYENSKRCYFGIPIPGNSMQVLVLDYRNIDGAAIAENPPIHISFTGKMIVSDLTRKWTPWTIPAWCGELMYRNTIAQPQIVFGCLTPAGAANSYILNDAQFHDDDFGVIPASYTTYFFVSHEMEQALQVGSHRKVYTMAAAFISGVGTWKLTPLAAALSNAFPSSPSFPLSMDPLFDMDFGINVTTTRCAFTIKATPLNGSQDSYFKLQKLVINMSKDPNAAVRGSSGGSF